MSFIKLARISPFIFFINISIANNLRSDINTNSLIKIFCKENVKSEFKKNNFEYEESIGEDICNCYLKNISKNITHEDSISKCKLKKIKSY